jgi:4-carboxymuconolactone decarboxylase
MALPHRENPRIEPIDDPGPEVAELLGHTMTDTRGTPLTIFRTMARHPALLKRWNVIAGFFRTRGVLPAHAREIVTLRTAWRIDCQYEWGQHVLIARAAGVADEDITPLAQTTPSMPKPDDDLLVRLVDELVDADDVSDPTWNALTAHYRVEEVFELIMLVGLYRMAGGFLNATGVQPEPHLPTWPADVDRPPARTPVSTTGAPA